MLRIEARTVTEADLMPAVEALRAGRVVAFATDTLYGLAVDPASEAAVRALFQLKGRDSSAAVPLVAASRAQVEAWCGLSPTSRAIADAFWPGPVSLICDAPGLVVAGVHGGRRTVAIRVPDHPVARALAAAFGGPITATSANRSGDTPARTALEAAALAADAPADRPLLVIDSGPSPGGPPSTIIDARGTHPVLVRDGAIPFSRVLHSLQQ